MRLKVILVAIILSVVSGCESTPSVPVLPLPPPLVLPMVEEGGLACLGNDAYLRLVERDAMLQARLRTLEGIIRSTHR